MPEAIATSKRKFYKALDALTNNVTHASLSAPPQPVSSTPPSSTTKRSSAAAFDEARERARKRLRQSTSTTSLDASVISLPRGKNATKTNSAPPHFSPWSQETFLSRLKTFSSVSLWHPKPDVINEVAWAKRGWVCVDVNTVACRGGCERRVVVSIDVSTKAHAAEAVEEEDDDDDDDDDTSALEEALAERYKAEIVEGHASTCLWHQQGCKDDIYRLPVVRPSVWQPELRHRLHSLTAIYDSVQRINTRSVDPTSHKLLHELPHDVLGITTPPDEQMHKAFEIAMHGWRGFSDSGNQLLTCDACFQRIGLWLYQPDYRRPRSRSSEFDEDEALLDLVETHRDHCPWRNSQTQQATGSLHGLNAIQILHRVVATAARDHRRRSDRLNTENDQEGAEDEASQLLDSTVRLSRAEIDKQDKERESRLRKIKNLFNIKRRPTTKAPIQKAS